MASGGYPADYEKGFPISGLEEAAAIEDLVVFHAGTALKDGRIVNSGGRVLGVTGLGRTVAEAIDKAYAGVEKISWQGVQYRRDIGQKALNR
jgi:phosphoribosylamine--glycine ligase